MERLGRIVFVTALSSLLAPFCVNAQAARQVSPEAVPPAASGSPHHRLKIGLALSGGGARGVTHIGILRALERMHIPIDYVAGTSMGAIVGGLYAAGATTQDLETLVRTTDWGEILSDRPTRDMLSFREKEDDRRYIEGLDLGLDAKGLHVTEGLINGQKFLFMLESNTLKVSTIVNFDDLPIPFRCVATDLATGDKFVFSKGSLPWAIRASMSLPAIFTPVEEEGHILVDGGIADNLPVDVVRAMGADVVIAVDIGTPPLDCNQINSPVAVYGQVLNVLMQKEIRAQAGNATLLLRPPLGRVGIMDFPNSLKLIPVGEKIVEDNAAALAKYAVSAEEYAAWEARVRGPLPPPSTVDFVEFAGTDPADEARLRDKMKTRPGEPIDIKKLQEDLLLVYDTGDYAAVNYEIVQRGDKKGVVITARPDPIGPNYIRFGTELSSDFKYNSNWSIFAGLRFTRLNRLDAEWKSDLEIGLNQRLYTEWYQPLSRGGRVFLAPYLSYSNELDYVFLNARMSDPSANYRTSQGWAGLDLGFNIGRSGQLRFGPRWGNASFTRAVGGDLFPNFHASLGEIRLAYEYDRLDSADFPTRGIHATLAGLDSERGMGATDSYQTAELKFHAYQRLDERSSIFEWISAGTSFATDVPYYDWFRIGGPSSFGGFMEGQLTGPYYGAVRLGYQYRFANFPAIVGTGAYAVVFADAGNSWILPQQIGWSHLKGSGTIGFGSSTKLGPVLFGYSYASGKSQMLFLSVGKRW